MIVLICCEFIILIVFVDEFEIGFYLKKNELLIYWLYIIYKLF